MVLYPSWHPFSRLTITKRRGTEIGLTRWKAVCLPSRQPIKSRVGVTRWPHAKWMGRFLTWFVEGVRILTDSMCSNDSYGALTSHRTMIFRNDREEWPIYQLEVEPNLNSRYFSKYSPKFRFQRHNFVVWPPIVLVRISSEKATSFLIGCEVSWIYLCKLRGNSIFSATSPKIVTSLLRFQNGPYFRSR